MYVLYTSISLHYNVIKFLDTAYQLLFATEHMEYLYRTMEMSILETTHTILYLEQLSMRYELMRIQ